MPDVRPGGISNAMTNYRYAFGTKVSVKESKGEVMDLLDRIGATMPSIGWLDDTTEVVAFKLTGVPIMLTVAHPVKNQALLDDVQKWIRAQPSNGGKALPRSVDQAYDMEARRRWRIVVIQIKAMATLILDAGIDPVRAFIGNVAIGGGMTVADKVMPDIVTMVETGKMPTLAIGSGS